MRATLRVKEHNCIIAYSIACNHMAVSDHPITMPAMPYVRTLYCMYLYQSIAHHVLYSSLYVPALAALLH